jgi:Siphovirus Gp157
MSSDLDRVGDDAASAPPVPSAYQLEHAISVWQQLRAELVADEELVEDENTIAVALRAADAKDPRDLCAKLVDACVWADRRAEEAKAIADEFTARRKRYEARVERFRDLIERLMAAIPVRKQAGRFARASIVAAPQSLLVTDEQLIPDEYFKVERTLRRSEVLSDLKVGVVVDGAQISNGGETLRIARVK